MPSIYGNDFSDLGRNALEAERLAAMERMGTNRNELAREMAISDHDYRNMAFNNLSAAQRQQGRLAELPYSQMTAAQKAALERHKYEFENLSKSDQSILEAQKRRDALGVIGTIAPHIGGMDLETYQRYQAFNAERQALADKVNSEYEQLRNDYYWKPPGVEGFVPRVGHLIGIDASTQERANEMAKAELINKYGVPFDDTVKKFAYPTMPPPIGGKLDSLLGLMEGMGVVDPATAAKLAELRKLQVQPPGSTRAKVVPEKFDFDIWGNRIKKTAAAVPPAGTNNLIRLKVPSTNPPVRIGTVTNATADDFPPY